MSTPQDNPGKGGWEFFRRCPRCGHKLPWVTRCRICGAPGRRCRVALAALAVLMVGVWALV